MTFQGRLYSKFVDWFYIRNRQRTEILITTSRGATKLFLFLQSAYVKFVFLSLSDVSSCSNFWISSYWSIWKRPTLSAMAVKDPALKKQKRRDAFTRQPCHSPAFGRIEPAVWLIFNCFSSEYFFLRILKLEKRIFRGSLRERPALFRIEPQKSLF